MKRFINIALIACLLTCCGSVFAQEAPKDVKPADKPEVKMEAPAKKAHIKAFRPRIPRQVKSAIEFFKLADELELTDDQMIQLRGYYKKHLVKPEKKLEKPSMPSPEDFCKMTEEEMKKFAENESKKVHDAIMGTLQKIIDIKKILSPEQFQKLREKSRDEAKKALAKMAEASKKAKEQKKKDNCCKGFRPDMMPHMGQMCCPMMGGRHGMKHQMGPQCPMMGGRHGMKHQMGPQCPMMGGRHGMNHQMGRCPKMGGRHGMEHHMGSMCPMMGDRHGMNHQMRPRFPKMDEMHGMNHHMGSDCPMMGDHHGMMPQMRPGMKGEKHNHDFKKSPCFGRDSKDFDEKAFFKFMKKFFDWQKKQKCDTMDLGNKSPKFDSLKKDGEKLPPLHMNKPEGPKAAPKGPAEKEVH